MCDRPAAPRRRPGFYQSWADAEGVEVLAVQPPGREARAAELPITDLRRLVRQTANEIAGICESRPTALIGHPGGARYAFELSRALERANRGPALLGVCGVSAPDQPSPVLDRDRRADDRRPRRRMLESFNALIRADARLYTGLGIQEPVRLRCAIAAFAGDHDPLAEPKEMAGWHAWATAPEAFTLHEYPGDNFFIRHRFQAMLDDLLTALARTVPATLAASWAY
ncbi:thioesterase II family protein [Streptomyces sp. NPDC051677]|uniref:thioesterase II family protein n=1 Tax=Streptomyces sp. NPDC051677 TaxID=3365669 RepID=UPI0037CF3AC1